MYIAGVAAYGSDRKATVTTQRFQREQPHFRAFVLTRVRT